MPGREGTAVKTIRKLPPNEIVPTHIQFPQDVGTQLGSREEKALGKIGSSDHLVDPSGPQYRHLYNGKNLFQTDGAVRTVSAEYMFQE